MPGRVYILGAGVSYSDTLHMELGLPLARGFFSKKLIDEYWNTATNVDFLDSALVKVIQHYFDLDVESLGESIWDTNVEDVYSFLDTAVNIYPNAIYLDRIEFQMALDQLTKYIATIIYYIPFNLKDTEFHSYLSESLKTDDSIISFNWDLLLENLLWSDNDEDLSVLIKNQMRLLHDDNYLNLNSHAYDSARDRLHEGVLLKMHGSVNFAICGDRSCPKSEYPILFRPFDAESLDSWTCPSCGAPVERFILPPHINKTYEPIRFLRLQARVAAQKLAMAEEIVIVGYSFPIYDMEALSMIRLARLDMKTSSESEHWLKKISIVDPMVIDDSWVSRVSNLFGVQRCFENFGHEISVDLYKSVSDFIKQEKNT